MSLPQAEDRSEFEARLEREARRFDLKPLLDLLRAKGYAREDLLFEGAREQSSSRSIVEAVRFFGQPRRVLITLNLGLVASGLLPSYFLAVVEASPDPERFYNFIRFFDHHLIGGFVRAVYPEDNPRLYRDYGEVLRTYLAMLGPASVGTLHWLLALHFPELGVRLTRCTFLHQTASYAVRLGEARLDGAGILGRVYPWGDAGFVAELIADEETDERGQSWASVVAERLGARLLPLLAPFRVPLVVRLRTLRHARWATLGPRGYLGYDRMRGDPGSGHVTQVYSGVAGEDPTPLR